MTLLSNWKPPIGGKVDFVPIRHNAEAPMFPEVGYYFSPAENTMTFITGLEGEEKNFRTVIDTSHQSLNELPNVFHEMVESLVEYNIAFPNEIWADSEYAELCKYSPKHSKLREMYEEQVNGKPKRPFLEIGTRSVLYGAHCFFLHPWFVALAWWKLYGFPFDPRLWVAFFVHDLGYWGKPNMDGEEGEKHPYWGARLMGKLFDEKSILSTRKWYYFTLYHSRFLAKKEGGNYSRLCVADKLALTLTPGWLYLPMVRWTGEIHEYMKDAQKNSNGEITATSQKQWFDAVRDYVFRWVQEHKDLKEDNWTTSDRSKFDKNGVYK